MKNQATITLRITFLNQVRSLFTLFLFSLICFGGNYFIFEDVNFLDVLIKAALVLVPLLLYLFGFFIFPGVFIHINYLMKNSKEEYEVGDGKIVRRKEGVETIFDYSEIEEVYLCLSPEEYRKDPIRMCPYDNYNFARIKMKSGEMLYLTSLLYPPGIEEILKKYMKGVPYKREKRFFPSTRCKFGEEAIEKEPF